MFFRQPKISGFQNSDFNNQNNGFHNKQFSVKKLEKKSKKKALRTHHEYEDEHWPTFDDNEVNTNATPLMTSYVNDRLWSMIKELGLLTTLFEIHMTKIENS
uniref:Uncharacterized protein n=1 Tax=Lactuca sativa TaxID=4236 RepID=A0A9R1WXF3_LACSA|nr:hypothetical protein LSAT_V11C800401410 [Lactuca sativa]